MKKFSLVKNFTNVKIYSKRLHLKAFTVPRGTVNAYKRNRFHKNFVPRGTQKRGNENENIISYI
jgi:hypothetical protein